MKKNLKSIVGATLLEIMLVLAIAAMIIVMSVRYYQTASSSAQANATIELIQAITAAADSIAQSTGTYTSATSANIVNLGGAKALALPWGGNATIPSPAATSYTVQMPNMPTATCSTVALKLKNNTHYSVTGCMTYIYTP